MQLGWRYPDATPAQDTRYQDIRLYGRALSSEEAPDGSRMRTMSPKYPNPSDKWSRDQRHAVSDFYLNYVDQGARSPSEQIQRLNTKLAKLSKGGDLTLVAWEKPSIPYANILTRGVYTARTESSGSEHAAFSSRTVPR